MHQSAASLSLSSLLQVIIAGVIEIKGVGGWDRLVEGESMSGKKYKQ